MTTTVGLLHLEFYVGQAANLKDKRRVIKSFKDRLGNKFNVSIAEVDGLNSHRKCVLAISAVGSDSRRICGLLQRIVNIAAAHRDMVLVSHEIELI